MEQFTRKTLKLLSTHTDIFVGIAFIIVGITIYILSFTQAPGISDFSLSPGFFPRLAASLIAGLSLLLIVLTVFMRDREHVSVAQQAQWRTFFYVIGTSATMILYVYLIGWVGFILATIIIMAGMMMAYGLRRWILIALIAVCCPVAVYYLALKVMHVLFPAGAIFE